MNIMDKFSLKGKKAIVTGGARGLNHGMAEGLHEAGAEVVLFDIMDLVYESAEKMSTPEAPGTCRERRCNEQRESGESVRGSD